MLKGAVIPRRAGPDPASPDRVRPDRVPPEAVDGGWWVYVVRCADGTLYTGIARDPGARVDVHNAGRGARYTRGRRPVALVFAEPAADRGTALRREAAIKRLPARAKRALATARQAPLPLPASRGAAGEAA